MIILVGVTINVALNGGIFEKADKASRDTEMNAIYEIIISASQYDSNGNINVDETYNAAKQTLNSNGYKEVSDLVADGSFTVTGKNGKNKYKYKITKNKIETIGLANEDDPKDDEPKDDPSITYALVKEEEQDGENVITAIYANQAQAYVGTLNKWIVETTENIPNPPTEGITQEEKTELEGIKEKALGVKNALAEYSKDSTQENANKFSTAYSEYNTAIEKYKKITINNNCVINATNENTSFKSLGDYVELTGTVTFGDNITKVSGNAFAYNETIKEVVFSESVSTIGEKAFAKCKALERVIIPENSVTTIEDYAFKDCLGLEYVEISNSVTTIGNYAFYWNAIKEIEIPSSVTTIGEGAFASGEKLTNIVLNNSITGANMFSGCTALEEVTIPKNITTMGGSEFSNCTNLKNVSIENDIISSNEFWNTGIVEITIPGNVKTIGEGAFKDCISLKRVIIENGVEEIVGAAFGQTTKLDSITIPTSIKTVGEIFYTAPTDVYYEGTVEQWNAIENFGESNGTKFYDSNTKIHMSDGTTYIYDSSCQLVQNPSD